MPTDAEAIIVGKSMHDADDPSYCDPESFHGIGWDDILHDLQGAELASMEHAIGKYHIQLQKNPANASFLFNGLVKIDDDKKKGPPPAKKQRTETPLNLKKGPFSPEEDAIYLELLNKHGAPKKKDNPEAWAAFRKAFRCAQIARIHPKRGYELIMI